MLIDNLNSVNERIANACASCGRNTSEVKIVAITKTQSAQTINELEQYGILTIGENRVQELLQKIDSVSLAFDIQIVGQLQLNKVKYIVDKVSCVQSCDRIELAQEISKRLNKSGKPMDVLLEVNVSGIEGRGGVEPNTAALDRLCEQLAGLDMVRVKGLMAVAPVCEQPDGAREYFALARKLYEHLCECVPGVNRLSMGMSADFEQAIKEGATEVRLGTALFGKRNK